jgi:hypothetical protein
MGRLLLENLWDARQLMQIGAECKKSAKEEILDAGGHAGRSLS